MLRQHHDTAERIGLVCTVCGTETQPERDRPPSLWFTYDETGEWPATWDCACFGCTPKGGKTARTTHFVDTLHEPLVRAGRYG